MNGLSTLKKSCLRRTSANIISSNDWRPLGTQSSPPSPPPLFCNAKGSVNPLLASVLAKIEASESSNDQPFTPQPPKPEGSSTSTENSFEASLRAAIARRRKQMNQSRESSESDDELYGVRKVTTSYIQAQGKPSSSSVEPKSMSFGCGTIQRQTTPGNRCEMGDRGRPSRSGAPSQPPAPPPPPPPPQQQMSGGFRGGLMH